jgi:hypothetical protein
MKKFFTLLMAISAIMPNALAKEFVPVLKEAFSRAESTTPGGGYYSESLYFTASDHADNDGWYSQATYESERAVKLNAKTKTGYITTPAINLSSDKSTVKVIFRAQTWSSDNIYVCVEVDGDTSTTQKVDSDVSTNIVDRSEAPFELTFTNVPNGSKFKFYAERRDAEKQIRFFLSDVVILEEVDEATAPALYSSAYYHLFDDLMAGNDSETRSLVINGINCSSPITLQQADNSNFAITKGSDWNDLTGGTLNFKFVPLNAGNKLEALTIKSGDVSENILLAGHAKVYSPIVADATNATANGFTANWEQAAGMDNIILSVYTKEEDELVSSNLMFTKYIEGSSNNRALEIFNGTGKTVNLNGWKLLMESNGSGGLTSGEYALPDVDLQSGKTFTLCNSNYSALRDIADKTVGYNDGGYSNITTFTGDDAIGLFDPEGNLIDLLGYESYDCNDRLSGDWGADVTYYRRSDSYDPHPKFYVQEWEKHDKDYAEGYGTHNMDARGLVRKMVAQLTLDGNATSADIKNLTPGTTYYYAVEGLSNGLYTPYSDEATVTLPENTGIESAVAQSQSYKINGNQIAILSDSVKVYTIEGILMPSSNGTVTLPAHGVYLIATPNGANKICY